MRLVLPVVTLVAVALCPVTTRAQKADIDACSLLTASEASTAIGVTVTQGHHVIEPTKISAGGRMTRRQMPTIAGSRC